MGSGDLAAPALAQEAEQLEALGYVMEMHTPSSSAGKKAIKGNKERFRVLAR